MLLKTGTYRLMGFRRYYIRNNDRFSNLYREKTKRTRQDLNPRPTDPKSAALSTELRVLHQ